MSQITDWEVAEKLIVTSTIVLAADSKTFQAVYRIHTKVRRQDFSRTTRNSLTRGYDSFVPYAHSSHFTDHAMEANDEAALALTHLPEVNITTTKT